MITPDLILQPFAAAAAGADIQAPPQTSAQGFVNYTDGYTSFYEISLAANNPAAKAVERPVQNYLFNSLTKNAQAWQTQGIPPWFTGKPGGYPKNAIVLRTVSGEDRPYRSRIAANVSDPINSPTNWEYWPFAAEILQNVPMPSGGPNGATAMIVGVATNFNTFLTGTWVFKDAIAAASPNAPADPLLGSAASGTLEALTWLDGITAVSTTTIQRYVDINGNIFVRRGLNSTFPNAWVQQLSVGEFQKGSYIFGLTTGTGAAYALSLNPSLGSLKDGAVIRVRFHAANTGAATINVNGLGARTIYGGAYSALTGGEININSIAELQYSASPAGWLIKSMVGSPRQGMAAVKPNQFTTLQQVNDLITQAGVTTVEWVNVLNKPAIVFPDTNAQLLSLTLKTATPYINFNGNNSATYTNQISTDGSGMLNMYGPSGVNIARFSAVGSSFYSPVLFRAGNDLQMGQYQSYVAADNTTQLFSFNHDTNALALRTWQTATTNSVCVVFRKDVNRADFTVRPLFAGNTPWDTGNFNPGDYLKNGATTNMLAGTIFQRGALGNMANAQSGLAAFRVASPADGASAAIEFYVPGQRVGYFGIDGLDGEWKVGGGTYGANKYDILHLGNFNFWLQYTMAGNALFALGSYGLFGVNNLGSARGPGTLVSYTNIYYAAADGYGTGTTAAAGTWRLCGSIRNSNSLTASSVTVCQRVS